MNNSALIQTTDSTPVTTETPTPEVQKTSQPANHLPSVVIDLRKNLIRIHKQTLHLLGDPDFVQILVNPENHTIAIRSSSPTDYRSQRIRWKTIAGKQSCELYSKYLVESLQDAFRYLDHRQAYRITGRIFKQYNLAHFDIKESVCIGTTGGPDLI